MTAFFHNITRLLKCVRDSLGLFAAAIAASSLLLFFGTIISGSIEAIYLSYKWELNPLIIAFVILAALLILWLMIRIFMRLTAYLASIELLPHLYTNEYAKNTFFAGFVPLILAAFTQLFIYEFEHVHLIYALITSLALFLTIYFSSVSLHFATTARREKSRGIKKGRIFLFILFFALAVLAFAGLLYACVRFWEVTLIINAVLVGIVTIAQVIIYNYYKYITSEISVDLDNLYLARPSNVQAFVMVSKFNKPTVRAISYAKAMHPDLTILTICTKTHGELIRSQWERSGIQVPLRLFKPQNTTDYANGALEFIKSIHIKSVRDLIIVYMPHYTSRHALESIMHNKAAARLTAILETIPNVVVCSIPWQRQ